ncbi:MAG: type IV toxin-antitoxin system AbiEi family antitoxin domain-containing protein [Jatrophihabitantaceae bacterium]
MHPIPYLAERQCGVFSASQAASEGWTQDALRWAVRRGRLSRLRAGVFQSTEIDYRSTFDRQRWLHAAPAIAGVLATPGAMASHSTAAILRGLPLAFLPEYACLSVVPWHTGEVHGVHVHRTTSEELACPVAAVTCSTAARAAVDLAREHGAHAGVVPLDYALRHGLTDEDELTQTLHHCRRWPGVVAARKAVAMADPRSESPLESLSRLKFEPYDIPMPELQTSIGDEHRRFLGRVDFFWREFGVVGECDGALKYVGDGKPSALMDEKARQERLEEVGLIVVRWGWTDLARFDAVADRLRRAFGRASSRPIADRRWTTLPL